MEKKPKHFTYILCITRAQYYLYKAMLFKRIALFYSKRVDVAIDKGSRILHEYRKTL